MPTLTVFTPTYNRAHTLPRTYASLCRQTCTDFEWLVIDDGSTDDTSTIVKHWCSENKIPIRYIYKENGGLYTGYNTAYLNMDSELCVCIDSDDYMPDDAVGKIIHCWKERGGNQYAGIIGLDYFLDGTPIGGFFPKDLKTTRLLDLYTNRIHIGDTKSVLRTDLMKEVAPQIGFPGEKNFNPVYMQLQVDEKLPMLVINENLCFVEYQDTDSMSKGIFRQYMNSPRSFAKLRILEMTLSHSPWWNKVRSAIHYVANCIIAGNRHWLKESPLPCLTLIVSPAGVLVYFYILYKAKR